MNDTEVMLAQTRDIYRIKEECEILRKKYLKCKKNLIKIDTTILTLQKHFCCFDGHKALINLICGSNRE